MSKSPASDDSGRPSFRLSDEERKLLAEIKAGTSMSTSAVFKLGLHLAHKKLVEEPLKASA